MVARWTIIGLALVLTIGTLLSLIKSYYWWMRVWDFPRLAIFCLAAVVLVAGVIWLAGLQRAATVLAMIGVMGAQGWRIYPYSPFAPTEVAMTTLEQASCVKAISFNVLQTNRDYARTLAMLEREDPDILLLLETDKAWGDALAPVLDRYPHRHDALLDNLYGLIMVSRLEVQDGEVRYLVDDGTPSVFAKMKTPDGTPFQYIGLHPRPPAPGEDTEERDAEIAIAARIAAKSKLPVLAMGDFNDVAWSRTSRMFKRIGGYLDPRIGRGLYATFPAKLPMVRWPLDHLFISPEFTVGDMRVLEELGSDHLPVSATLCLAPREAEELNATPAAPDVSDQQTADEAIRDGIEHAENNDRDE